MRDWTLATDEEWQAELDRRWAEIVADNTDPPMDDEPDEIDRQYAEDLERCR